MLRETNCPRSTAWEGMALGSSDSKSLLCLFFLGMFPDLSYKIENEVLLKDIFYWKNFALFLNMQKY